MKQIKKWMSKWLVALLATAMVLLSLVGCSAGEVDKALDAAIEVIEVVEALEALESMEALESGSDSQISETISASMEDLASKLNQARVEADTSAADSENASAAEEVISAVEEDAPAVEDDALTVEEDGHYTSKEEVALYIHLYGKLPSNFISKKEAEDLGWKKQQGEKGQLHVVAPGMSIGGSSFGNYEGLLPEKKGRKYYECDINYVKGNRGAERIVYSNDGLIFYTGDHYESFEQLYPQE